MNADYKRARITEMLSQVANDLKDDLDPADLAAAFASVAVGVLAVRVYGGDMIAAADHLRDYGEQLCRWHERTKGNA